MSCVVFVVPQVSVRICLLVKDDLFGESDRVAWHIGGAQFVEPLLRRLGLEDALQLFDHLDGQPLCVIAAVNVVRVGNSRVIKA